MTKRNLSGLSLVAFLSITGFLLAAKARTVSHIAAVSVSEILADLPETKKVHKEIEVYAEGLRKELREKEQKLMQKHEAFEKAKSVMTEERQAKEQNELMQMQMNLQKLSEESQEKVQKEALGKYKPLYDRINKAAEKVAKRRGHTCVINKLPNMGEPLLVYIDNSANITAYVKKELGIKKAK